MPDERIIAIDANSPLMPAVYRLRHDVFVIEQAVPAALERDAFDKRATHLVALNDGAVVGTLRIVVSGVTAKVGRMAVAQAARRTGIGSDLIQRATAVARELGAHEIVLHAQLSAKDFYARLGYREEGEIFDEAGIPHVRMRKTIA
jgi:predicted GNAT family N-acyltransferase